MNEGLIRVRDYAQKCGCTPQNIYGHLKTYATELEGHTFKGKGRQGILLDGFAQDFLQGVMYPKELAESALADEVNTLRRQLLQASVEATRLASKLASVEGERDRALLELGENQKALMASREAEEAKEQELEEAKEKVAQEAQKAAEALEDYQQAAEALEKMRDEAFMRLQQAESAEEREQEALREAQTLREQLEALKGRSWWARLTRKGE